jgi:hypothetical protein
MEVNVVAVAHQAAAQVLDVDVAPRPGEHVPVGHDQSHEAIPNTHTPLTLRFHAHITEDSTEVRFEPVAVVG